MSALRVPATHKGRAWILALLFGITGYADPQRYFSSAIGSFECLSRGRWHRSSTGGGGTPAGIRSCLMRVSAAAWNGEPKVLVRFSAPPRGSADRRRDPDDQQRADRGA